MSAAAESRVPEPPPQLWHVLGILETVAAVALEGERPTRDLVERWIQYLDATEAEGLVGCLEIVVVGLDYVEKVIASLMGSTRAFSAASQALTAGLPANPESRRARVSEIVQSWNTENAHEEELLEGDDRNRPLETEESVQIRWALRHTLALVETAVATTRDSDEPTFEAVAERIRLVGEEDLVLLLSVAGALEAALAYVLKVALG